MIVLRKQEMRSLITRDHQTLMTLTACDNIAASNAPVTSKVRSTGHVACVSSDNHE
jgi:hypothetical protein